MTNQTPESQASTSVEQNGDSQRRLEELQAECRRLREALAHTQCERDLFFKALRACLPPGCTPQEAAEWVDIVQDYRDGKLVSAEEFHALIEELEKA